MQKRILIVDGHSIIFAWPEMRSLHARRNILAREAVVKLLTEYYDFSDVHVVAVFDGQGGKVTEETEPGGIQVFYSGSGQTADDVIERLVAKYGAENEITVATNDLLEQQTVMVFGAQCISAEGLKSLLNDARIDLQRQIRQRNKR